MKLSWPIVGASWIAEIRSRPTHCVRQLSTARHRRTNIWRRLQRPTGHPSGLTFHHWLSISVNCWCSCSCLYMHMLQLWWYMYDIMILCHYLDPNALFQILNCTEKCVWRLGALWTHWREEEVWEGRTGWKGREVMGIHCSGPVWQGAMNGWMLH